MKIGASLVELVMPTVIGCAAQIEADKVAATSPINIAYLTASSRQCMQEILATRNVGNQSAGVNAHFHRASADRDRTGSTHMTAASPRWPGMSEHHVEPDRLRRKT
jgi:hypothetical protein